MRAMPFSIALIVSLATTSRSGQPANPRGIRPEDFAQVKSFKEAIEVIVGRLKNDGKPEYAALISEARVREAVQSAVRSYEAMFDEVEKRRPGSKEYFLKEVKPICTKIADKGEWSPGCSFFSFYTLGDEHENVYHGLGLRLRIETPGAATRAFALPVIDLYFGRFSK